MRLDYNEKTKGFALYVPRSDAELVKSLMFEFGMDFSVSGSTDSEAMLFTYEPFCAVTFIEVATPRARAVLGRIANEIALSSAQETWWTPSWTPPDKALWPFQCADLEYALRRKHCLVGDQPGLGKTPVAISYANEIEARHVLVVAPANIRLQWARRIREWSRMSWELGRHCVVHSITSGRRGVAPTAELEATWNIVSYDLARQPAIGRALARNRYDLIIADEAHYLKTTDSKRTRAIFGGGLEENRDFPPIMDSAEHFMGLTGTPLPNRPREAYTMARAINWDSIDWLSEDGFRDRFNPSMMVEGERKDGTPFTYVDERSGRHSELQNRLRASFMTRHLKRDVLTQLAIPSYDLIEVEADGAIKKALAAEKLLDINPDDLEGANAAVLGHIAVVRHQMGVAMAPHVADYLEMLIDGGEEKLVVFAWHIEVLDILENRLKKHGLVRIDGRTSPSRKDYLVNQVFVQDPGVKFCIGNIQSMGTGTDGLQEVCTHALIAEASWTPGENVQCFDRLDRMGQTGQVQGDIFVVPGSISERVLAGALRKLHVTDAALDRKFSVDSAVRAA